MNTKSANDQDSIGRGGFIPANIRKSVLLDCLQSGDPVSFFAELQDSIKDIQIEIDEYYGDEDEYWDRIEDELDFGGQEEEDDEPELVVPTLYPDDWAEDL